MTADQIQFIVWIVLLILSATGGFLFNKVLDHEKRIQRVEDVQGTKIDAIGLKVDRLEETVKELSINIHKEKNMESQFTAVMQSILHFMERHEGNFNNHTNP